MTQDASVGHSMFSMSHWIWFDSLIENEFPILRF